MRLSPSTWKEGSEFGAPSLSPKGCPQSAAGFTLRLGVSEVPKARAPGSETLGRGTGGPTQQLGGIQGWAGLGLRARAPPPDTGERTRARDCPCSGRIIKLEKFEKGGNKTKIKGKPPPSLTPDPAPGTPGAAGGGWARAGMGVTVEVRQVYQYPFEQVVASFLRKVRARSGTPGPGGCAIDPAASAGRTWVRPGLQFLEASPCRTRGRSVRRCTFASWAAAARGFSAVAGGRGARVP